MATLSVVVPFCNVEPYLKAALDSVTSQSLRDVEVVMVDDGSTDGSAVIAKTYAARDPRFRLIQQENQGPGPARNTGVRLATGKYLAFLDGDDVLAPHAYDLLVGSLEKTGSDIACGGVLRFSPAAIWASPAHRDIFKEPVTGTHAARHPVLLQDRTPWNKVFRRTFWDAAGLEFPAGLYEDAPVMVSAHVLSAATDVLRDIVYYWRLRQTGELSTTQRTRELSNIEDRMKSLRTIGEFLTARAPSLKPFYDCFALGIDIPVLASAVAVASDEDRQRIVDLAAGYLRTVDGSVFGKLLAITRLHCYLMRERMLPELLDVLKFWQRGDGLAAPVIRHGRTPRWYVQYPHFRDVSRGIPDEVYDATREMKLTSRLDAITWHEGRLRIEGHAFIRWLDAPEARDTRIRVTLRNSRTRRTIRLPVQRVHRPDVTARSGQAAASYDWSGFVVEVSPRRLAIFPGVWRSANWELRVRVSGPGISRDGPITEAAPGPARWPEGRWVKDGIWVQPAWELDGRFIVRGRRVGAFVTGCRTSGDTVEIEGWSASALSPAATLIIKPRRGGAPAVRIPVQPGGTGVRQRASFHARMPVARLVSSAEKAASTVDQAVHVHDEVICDVSLSTGGAGSTRLTAAAETAGTRAAHGGREIIVFVTQFGYLSAIERSRRPVISELHWASGPGGHRLTMRGTSTGSKPGELLLRHSTSGTQHAVALAWDGEQFTAELVPDRMPGIGGKVPLAFGLWDLLARTGEGEEVTVAAARSLLPNLPGYLPGGLREIAPQLYRTDALRLSVRAALADDERGRFAQRRLQRADYPAATTQPLRDLAVFISMGGRRYSCNPRAIYAEMRRRNPDLDYAWVTSEGQFAAPEGARLLLAGSREYYEAMACARYLVCNDMLPSWFRKREQQTCLQTWRGTPLKRVGLDIARPQFTNGLNYPDLIRTDAARWDTLLSQNSFSTPIFRRAFDFHGEILETGYPRNDVLRDSRREELAAATRQRLGIPAGKKVVLYAPTWRDDALPQNGGYRFALHLDLNSVTRALGDDHVLLLRMHSNIRSSSRPRRTGPAVLDVTGYPDMADLLLVTDVLITDYSSVMFDFACTGRPMLFFTYDLERYRGQLRGFYFDLETEAPGPLIAASADLVAAVRDIDHVARSYEQARAAFGAKFCPLDDGLAAARAVDRLLLRQ